MGFWGKHGSRRLAILTFSTLGVAACGSNSPTGPSSLSSRDAAIAMDAGSGSAASMAGGAELAAGDTIRITQGQLTLQSNHSGTITLRGSHGFTFEGHTLSGVDPSLNCNTFDPCSPGETVGFTATWVGLDLPGTARLQGHDYTDVGGLNSPSSLSLTLSGSFVAPPQANTATITVPFTVSGLFQPGTGPYDLAGNGTVTFTLAWQTALNGWAITSSSFDFGGGGKLT